MNPFHLIRRRLRALFHRQSIEREMVEEMRFHLQQRAADHLEDGLSADEARVAAERKFGHLDRLQEEVRDQRGWRWLENTVTDLRLAVRALRKSPGFTVVAVLTLGLGIGANTSMFSVLNGVLLKPLPYPDPDRLERIFRVTPQNAEGHHSAADVLDFARVSAGYGTLAAYTIVDASLAESGQPAEMVRMGRASAEAFPLLGVTPELGRGFRPAEDVVGNHRVVVLSQRLWRVRFGGEADIIGRTIRVDGEPHEIIGVLPASFNDWRHLGGVDFFRPLALTAEERVDRSRAFLRILMRLSPEVSRADAAGYIANFGDRTAAEHPQENAESTWQAVSLHATAAGRWAYSILPMLIGLSGFVLLIACSNLANLLLARTMARAREFAVRAALGASRVQLLRPLIAEALLLALAGGVGAILIAIWFRDWSAVRSTGDNGEQVQFVLDASVAAWAFGAALVTALAFGLAPALFALRLNLNDTLKSGGRGATGSRPHQRFRQALIVAQFALAMVLLAGAAWFIRGLYDLNNRRSGWESDGLVTGAVLLPAADYATHESVDAFQRQVLERIEALPGVASAGLASTTPFFEWSELRKWHVEGHERPEPGREPAAALNRVSPGYFETFGTPLLAGRAFSDRDTATSPPVFILGESTARALYGHTSPLGRRLAPVGAGDVRWGEVVGVVRDVRSVEPESTSGRYQVYQPMSQDPRRGYEVAVRAIGTVSPSLVESIRTTMAELDPHLPVRRLQPADTTILRANYQLGVLRDILGAIAALGLGLASLGLYGVIARTMAQRAGEFAIRLALGACVRDLTRLVLASGVKLALLGSVLGVLGALGVTQVLAAAFPAMQTNGLAVLGGTLLLLVAIALLACWLPARRAGQVDAMSVLRAE